MRAPGGRSAAWFCACGLALVAAAPASAGAARFKVSLQGRDSLAWSVGHGVDPTCERTGAGRQTAVFESVRPLTVQIGRIAARGGHTLVFGHRGGISIPSRGSLTRSDETSGSYTFRQMCRPLPPKDCGTRALGHFEPTLGSDSRGELTLEGFYWPENGPPFHNCVSLQTPVNLAGVEQPYTGWSFGEQILSREQVPLATRAVVPSALRAGRSYRFLARTAVHVSDGELHGFVIWDNGGTGDVPEAAQSEAPDSMLGGERSVTDAISWTVTLERVG